MLNCGRGKPITCNASEGISGLANVSRPSYSHIYPTNLTGAANELRIGSESYKEYTATAYSVVWRGELINAALVKIVHSNAEEN